MRAAARRGRSWRSESGHFGRFASTARAAQPARVVVVGAGLAGLTAAHRLRQAGCSRRGARGIRPGRWALLDDPGRVRRRSDRRARWRADRPGAHGRCASSAQELGLRARQPASRASRTGASPAYYFDGADYPVADRRLSTCGTSGRSSTATSRPRATRRSTTAPPRARLGARPDVDRRLDQRVGARRDRLPPGAVARRRLQHRVRRGVERAKLAEPDLSPRLPGARQLPDLREVEREVPRPGRERSGGDEARRRPRGADHPRLGARGNQAATQTAPTP